MWPTGLARSWPQGYSLNKLGRGLLDEATYQISSLEALWFLTRRCLSQKSIFSLCDLDMEWTRTSWTLIKESHLKINPAEFDKNPASSLEDVVDHVDRHRMNGWTDGWTYGRRQISYHHNISPWAYGSGELKGLQYTKMYSLVNTQHILLWGNTML